MQLHVISLSATLGLFAGLLGTHAIAQQSTPDSVEAPVPAAKAAAGTEYAGVLSEFKPAGVSFHFGLPAADLLARVRACGAKILSSATTVNEARWLADHGVDAIIAQGLEAGGAAAAWERAAATDDGMAIYADPATRKITDDVAKMWGLLDYKAAEKDATGKPYLSAKLLQEFDCKGGRTRYFSLHAGQMGSGRLAYSELRADSEWLPASRARSGEALWKIACGKQ